MFNSKFCKLSDSCTMGRPLSATFSNIYLTKLEINKVRLTKPLFYKFFVDNVINTRQQNTPDSLLTLLSCYRPNIDFPPGLLIPTSKLLMVKFKRLFTGSQISCLYIGHPKFPNVIKGLQ